MKWALVLSLGLVTAAAACQQGGTKSGPADQSAPKGAAAAQQQGSGDRIISLPKPTVTPEYKTDISNLCNSLQLSGALDKPKDERWVAIAMWLGPNIKTDSGRQFLAAIQPLRGATKVLALETEAGRVGLAGCPLADEWRGPAGEAPPAHL